jgi:1-acyl-sn-glycerol-3-phosphate acyltransferase
MAQGQFMDWWHGPEGSAWGKDPDDIDKAKIAATLRRIEPWFGDEDAYFPLTVDGWENIPSEASLVVGNHSGGTTIPDAWGWLASWYRHFGLNRPLHGLAHDMVFALPSLAKGFASLGLLRADRDLAMRVLRDQHRDIFVMPGGDRDTWRPWKDRYKVCFGGRVGYARIALKAGVPIVPVAHAGAHDTLIVLTDGRRIAHRLHLKRLFRAEIFPIHLSLPFVLGIGPLPHLPPPVQLRYRIAPPVYPPVVVKPGCEPTDEAVAAFDEAVRAALQAELDILRDTAPGRRERLRGGLRHAARTARSWIRGRGSARPNGRSPSPPTSVGTSH